MSKDKSKKTIDDDYAKPSEAPSGGDGFKLTEDGKDRLLLITPHREDTHAAFDKKRAAAGEVDKHIVADVVVIDEKNPAKSEEHENVWIFPAYVQGSLRGYIGERRVLARLRHTDDTTGEKSSFGKGYWVLEDATAKDVAKATAYREALTNPFGKKGKTEPKADKAAPGKKGKGKPAPEPEPKKKGKKK